MSGTLDFDTVPLESHMSDSEKEQILPLREWLSVAPTSATRMGGMYEDETVSGSSVRSDTESNISDEANRALLDRVRLLLQNW